MIWGDVWPYRISLKIMPHGHLYSGKWMDGSWLGKNGWVGQHNPFPLLGKYSNHVCDAESEELSVPIKDTEGKDNVF